MSRPQRTWTLDELHAEKCEDVGECWEWQGCMGGRTKQTPVIGVGKKNMQAYVFSWRLSKGLDATPEGLVFWRTCGNFRCINPGHVASGTPKQFTAFHKAGGAYKRKPDFIAHITAVQRSRAPKLSIELAREIRISDETIDQQAKRLGCSRSLVQRVKAGTTWREVTQCASIFAMGAA